MRLLRTLGLARSCCDGSSLALDAMRQEGTLMGDAKDSPVATKSSGRTRALGTKSSGRLKAAKLAEDIAPALKERILGALWLETKGGREHVALDEVREHLSDVTAADLERALCALVLDRKLD